MVFGGLQLLELPDVFKDARCLDLEMWPKGGNYWL